MVAARRSGSVYVIVTSRADVACDGLASHRRTSSSLVITTVHGASLPPSCWMRQLSSGRQHGAGDDADDAFSAIRSIVVLSCEAWSFGAGWVLQYRNSGSVAGSRRFDRIHRRPPRFGALSKILR